MRRRPVANRALRAAHGGHAERLFPLIEEVLVEAKLRADQVDRIAVTLGPGTFTGVRVGVAAARALSLGLRKPVVGITSLAAMAHRASQLLKPEHASWPLVVAVDARRGMIYLQCFDVLPAAAQVILSLCGYRCGSGACVAENERPAARRGLRRRGCR